MDENDMVGRKNIWFSSDYHLGHYNIIRFCNRPFDGIHEMTECIIANHNRMVGHEDLFFHLGDFAWNDKGKTIWYLTRLNGIKCFIAGNHDGSLFTRDTDFNIIIRDGVKPYVKWIKDYYEMTIQDKDAPRNQRLITLSHYAGRVWRDSHHGSFNLFGHSHSTLPDDPNALSIDVGVDAMARRLAKDGVLDPKDYRPISYNEIKRIMELKDFVPINAGKKK